MRATDHVSGSRVVERASARVHMLQERMMGEFRAVADARGGTCRSLSLTDTVPRSRRRRRCREMRADKKYLFPFRIFGRFITFLNVIIAFGT